MTDSTQPRTDAAKSLQRELAALGHTVPLGHALAALARMSGYADDNALKAAQDAGKAGRLTVSTPLSPAATPGSSAPVADPDLHALATARQQGNAATSALLTRLTGVIDTELLAQAMYELMFLPPQASLAQFWLSAGERLKDNPVFSSLRTRFPLQPDAPLDPVSRMLVKLSAGDTHWAVSGYFFLAGGDTDSDFLEALAENLDDFLQPGDLVDDLPDLRLVYDNAVQNGEPVTPFDIFDVMQDDSETGVLVKLVQRHADRPWSRRVAWRYGATLEEAVQRCAVMS